MEKFWGEIPGTYWRSPVGNPVDEAMFSEEISEGVVGEIAEIIPGSVPEEITGIICKGIPGGIYRVTPVIHGELLDGAPAVTSGGIPSRIQRVILRGIP